MIRETQKVRKVTTYGPNGKKNGWLMELYKKDDKTLLYLTACAVGAFKGYHLHKKRKARYVCIKGKFKVTLWEWSGNNWYLPPWMKKEYILEPQSTLDIPVNTPTGIENIGKEEGWIINFPDPAYDPSLKGEQVEYTEKELEDGVLKE